MICESENLSKNEKKFTDLNETKGGIIYMPLPDIG